jgi:hypothetical protein
MPRNPIRYSACYTQASTYIKPVILWLPHQSCYAQAPIICSSQTSSLLCPGFQHHHSSPISSLLCSGSYSKPAMARFQHVPTDIKPVMPRPLHENPSPTSSLSCSGSYSNPTITLVHYPISAYYAQAFTLSTQSYIMPVLRPGSYIKPAMLRLQHMLHPT